MSIETILQVVTIVAGIGGIIFVHELGHFLVCKLSKVKVDAFSMGFPPTGLGIRRVLRGLRVSLFPGLLRARCTEIGGIEEGSVADRAGIRIGDRVIEAGGAPAGRLDWAGLDARIRPLA
ncbi:MAG: site-2 protease family protein, partial [Planctomycetes bacterium]|nr:site-2 protease family protein [Planctomycetota bacterium]